MMIRKFCVALGMLAFSCTAWCAEPVNKLTSAYHIDSDQYMGPIKRTVEVKLAYKLSAEQLKAVAEKIKATEVRKTERTFIGYKLEGQQSPGYWATTNYDPALSVRIMEY